MTYKSFFLLCVSCLFLMSCKTSSPIITSKEKAQKMGIYKIDEKKVSYRSNKNEDSNEMTELILTKAKQFQGVKYKTGGTNMSGMDCSGFIIASFSDSNIKLPRTSNEMSRTGTEINKEQAKKGDLIFFKTNGRSTINHVGIVLEVTEDEIKFIHSSTTKGVIISTTKDSYYEKALAKINRVIE
jgi:murein DD-endopeptidase / murein LD-carboxypeptidase